jgi:hypothetical protein
MFTLHTFTILYFQVCIQDVTERCGRTLDTSYTYQIKKNTKTANISFENVANLKYLGTTLTHQNLIQVEIKRRLNLYNTFYHLVQKFSLLVCYSKSEGLEYSKL